MAHMSSAPVPMRFESLALSSSAALLVKVMAMTRQGSTGSTAHSASASGERTPLFSDSSSTRSSLSPYFGSTSAVSEPRPKRMRFATRFISTVVLPLPAPARSSSGPSVASTASLCLSLSS